MAVTLRHVAERAGVSLEAVSKVLNGRAQQARISAGRASQIERIARELNYRPNSAARAMATRQSKQVGVLIRNNPSDRYTHPLSFETILGINEGLDARGYVLSVVRIDDVEEGGGLRARALRERALDGFVVIDAMPAPLVERIEALAPHTIWADTTVWRPDRCVRRDEFEAGMLAMRALVDLGYRKVVWAGYPPSHQSFHNFSLADRYAGASSVCRAAGIEMSILSIADGKANHAPEGLEDALRPDVGVLAYGLYQARALAHMAGTMGLTPGHHFGLVCCDDSADTRRFWPGLSRASFDRFELGLAAAQMMLAVLDEPSAACPSKTIHSSWRPGNTAWGPRAV